MFLRLGLSLWFADGADGAQHDQVSSGSSSSQLAVAVHHSEGKQDGEASGEIGQLAIAVHHSEGQHDGEASGEIDRLAVSCEQSDQVSDVAVDSEDEQPLLKVFHKPAAAKIMRKAAAANDIRKPAAAKVIRKPAAAKVIRRPAAAKVMRKPAAQNDHVSGEIEQLAVAVQTSKVQLGKQQRQASGEIDQLAVAPKNSKVQLGKRKRDVKRKPAAQNDQASGEIEQLEVAAPKSKVQLGKRKRNELMGYGPSDQAFVPGREVHTKACPEEWIQPGDYNIFMTGVARSLAKGGVHAVPERQATSSTHWAAYRRYVGFLQPETPISFEDAFDLKSLKQYFGMLEDSHSNRGRKYKQSTIASICRSLCVVTSVFLKVRYSELNRRDRQDKVDEIVNEIRAYALSCRGAILQRGDDQAVVSDALKLQNPLTLSQMLANRKKYIKRAKTLKAKLARLSLHAPAAHRRYVKFRHARMRASILGNDFMLQTAERPESVLNVVYAHRLDWKSASSYEVLYMPLGAAPSKTSTAARLNRSCFTNCKTLTSSFGRKLDKYLRVYLPIIEQ